MQCTTHDLDECDLGHGPLLQLRDEARSPELKEPAKSALEGRLVLVCIVPMLRQPFSCIVCCVRNPSAIDRCAPDLTCISHPACPCAGHAAPPAGVSVGPP